MHELKTYPPRVKMSIYKTSTADSLVIPVKINGCTKDGQLNVDLLITRDSGGIYIVYIACNANLLGYYNYYSGCMLK